MMPQVVLTGWTPGLKKVSSTKLLRQKAGLGLKDAKDCTDRLLAGETVRVAVSSLATAEDLAREATALGADAHAEPGSGG
ncbi:MAG TPA: ribosomal protein L7/L12 [Chloroflexota bacterium]|nr:ribosomal protein L7/L12 [Chloroflexota bacterium]